MASRPVLRERGSGTREIFENILRNDNFSLHTFERTTEIGNMAAIKEMVFEGPGITVLFEVAARKEMESGSLCVANIPGLSEQREFS